MATTRPHHPLLASAEVVQKLQSRSQAARQLAMPPKIPTQCMCA